MPRSRSREHDRHHHHQRHHHRHSDEREGRSRSPRRGKSRSRSRSRSPRRTRDHHEERYRDRQRKRSYSGDERDRTNGHRSSPQRSSRSDTKDGDRHEREREGRHKDGGGGGSASPSKKGPKEADKSEPPPAKKPKKKAPTTVNLSFGDEMEEVRKTSVKLKSVEEVTAQRMQEEGRQRASNVRAAAAAGAALPRDNGSAPGRAQQVMDDEDDASESSRSAGGFTTIPKAAVAINRGPKAEMEDRHTIIASLQSGIEAFMASETPVAYYGVFDGHCGSLAAEVAASQLHVFLTEHKDIFEQGGRRGVTDEHVKQVKYVFKQAYLKTEEKIIKALQQEGGRRQDGAAALCAVLARNVLYVANAGDCRAVLGSMGEEGVEATRLSVDHKPNLTEEKERITKAGGLVEFHGVWRVTHARLNMRLAVSRSFGDPGFKGLQEGVPPLVSCEPYVCVRELRRGVDLCVVLASDGIWDVLTDQEAVQMVDNVIRGGGSGTGAGGRVGLGQGLTKTGSSRPWRPTDVSAKEAADLLVSTALGRGSGDNVTAIVVAFQWD